MPLGENKSPTGIKVIEQVILREADADSMEDDDTKRDKTVLLSNAGDVEEHDHDDIEREISEIVNQRDTISEDGAKLIALQQLETLVPARKRKLDIENKVQTSNVNIISDSSAVCTSKYNNMASVEEKKTNEEEVTILLSDKTPPRRILNKLALQPSPEKIDDNELIAILKGTDNEDCKKEVLIEGEGHFEVLEVVENFSEGVTCSKSSNALTKEEEGRIALEQINAISSQGKKRVRRRKQDIISTGSQDLANTLASEWSEEEEKEAFAADNVIQSKTIPDTNNKKEPSNSLNTINVSSEITPFKRSRIIKRKIIWDPDAPETQFSYASLVKSSKKETTKKVLPAAKKVLMQKKIDETNSSKLVGKRRSTQLAPQIVASKKKKISEVDKLLGDEGAANMINSIDGDRHKMEKEQRIKNDESLSANPKMIPLKKEITPKKRTPKPKPSSSWDYVYNQQSVDSMIIRRRSNSSYSSNASPQRLSVDLTPTNNKQVQKASSATGSPNAKKNITEHIKGKGFEFAKPEAKLAKKRNSADDFENISPVPDIKKSAAGVRKLLKGSTILQTQPITKKEVELEINKNVYHLIIDTSNSKIENTFSVQLMSKLTEYLDNFKNDNKCKVVVVTSLSQNFCQGLDFSDLSDANEKRKQVANILSKSVRNLLYALATFQKPLIAGVSGKISGLGVTMLSLFDIVIASDKTTFNTSYVKMGQIPEGFCLFNSHKKIRQNFITKLLWLDETLSAKFSEECGLITKLTNTAKVCEDALNCGRQIAGFSSEVYNAMKEHQIADLKCSLVKLDDEQKSQTQFWSSQEFITKLKKFVITKNW